MSQDSEETPSSNKPIDLFDILLYVVLGFVVFLVIRRVRHNYFSPKSKQIVSVEQKHSIASHTSHRISSQKIAISGPIFNVFKDTAVVKNNSKTSRHRDANSVFSASKLLHTRNKEKRQNFEYGNEGTLGNTFPSSASVQGGSSDDVEGDSDFSIPEELKYSNIHLKDLPFDGGKDYTAYYSDLSEADEKLSAIARRHAAKGHRRWCWGYVEYLKGSSQQMGNLLKIMKADKDFLNDMYKLGLDNMTNRFR